MTHRCWAEIDLAAVHSNVLSMRSYIGDGAHLMAVVKADAYGHGLIPVTRAALNAGASWIGTATLTEAITLREAGFTEPIMLLCAASPDDVDAIIDNRVTAMTGEAVFIEALGRAIRKRNRFSQNAAEVSIHLDLDTGIGRSGSLPENAEKLMGIALSYGIKVSGLSTHFACPDDLDEQFTLNQIDSFTAVRRNLETVGAQFDWIHCSAASALLRFAIAPGNLVRPGLLLYGIVPKLPQDCNPIPNLKPVLSLKTVVASVRDVPAGHPISYGATHRMESAGRVATLLIGYADGYPRRLSNIGFVLLHGKRAKILGIICMDQMVVDVTEIPETVVGSVAVCIGAQCEDRITVEELAATIGTTEHEITTCLSSRVPRCFSNPTRL